MKIYSINCRGSGEHNMKKCRKHQDKALLALKEAVKEVIERHKISGRPLAIWKDGKVVQISAEEALRSYKK